MNGAFPSNKYEYDIIVVGAGICGSALGFALGKQGRKVLVIERDLKEPGYLIV
jgi:squalene monooxygenase